MAKFGSSTALSGRNVTVSGVTFDHPASAAMNADRRVEATNVQVLGTNVGILARTKIEMRDSHAESTLQARAVHLVSSTVTGVAYSDAIIAPKARLEGSSVTGNNLDPQRSEHPMRRFAHAQAAASRRDVVVRAQSSS